MNMKNLWIIANWKANKSIKEALEWISIVGPKLEKREDLKVVVCPTFSALSEVKKEIMVGSYPLMVGAQDLSPFSAGAYTGEEPASILQQFVDLSIIGHSERRENFSETDEMVAKKVRRAIEANILPLVCLQGDNTPIPEGCNLVAYEPIFAIGSGNPDTPTSANEVAEKLKDQYGKVQPAGRQSLEVLYGGSVTADNAKTFILEQNINGLLIGKSSLDAYEFVEIVNQCKI